eukprot:scaffold439_cov107-Amphora_coffeaeformis.AAC.1
MEDSLSFEEKQVQLRAYAEIYVKRREANEKKGLSTRGILKRVLEDAHRRGDEWVTRQRLQYHIDQWKRKVELESVKVDGGQDSVSTLTRDSPSTNTPVPTNDRKRPGRPSSESLKNDVYRSKRIRRAHAVAAQLYDDARREKGNGRRCSNATLSDCISQAASQCHVEVDDIRPETVRKRQQRGNIKGTREATQSPLESLDFVINYYVQQLARIGDPLGKDDVVALANDILDANPKDKEAFISWKIKYCKNWKDKPGSRALVGDSWYSAYRRRNKHIFKTVRGGFTQDAKRQQWAKWDHFMNMYVCIYDRLISAGLAMTDDTESMYDRHGNVCDAEHAFGLPSKYRLIHPELFVFVDEMGLNTNQKEDGAKGGKTFLVPIDGSAEGVRGATTDLHCTVLGFTAGTGEPIMCAVIMKSQTSIPPSWVLGIDPMAEIIDADNDADLIAHNGHAMTGGPTCVFRGKEVPCFVCHSQKASITSTLLRDMLQRLDDLHLFENEHGLRPFLLLDGHHSRFELPFLDYITNKEHLWHVCIGVPYGTHIWQLADQSTQNGCFKMAWYEQKKSVTAVRDVARFYQTDIVPLIKTCWEQSFARVESNRKMICELGWGPLNFNILNDPRIAHTKNQSVTDGNESNKQCGNNHPDSDDNEGYLPSALPFGDRIERMHREQAKLQGLKDKSKKLREQRARWKDNRERINHSLLQLTRYSSGELASHGEYCLNHDALVEGVRRKTEATIKEALDKEKRKRDKGRKRRSGYQIAADKLRDNNMDLKALTVSELEILQRHMPANEPNPPKRRADLVDYIGRWLLSNSGVLPAPPPEVPDSPPPDPKSVCNSEEV